MANEEEERRAFKVQDRRRFSETGEARGDPGEREESPSPQPGDSDQAPPQSAAEAGNQGGEQHAPEITFATFVISLSTQALAHLGEIPDLVERSVQVDLAAARQTIDILGILREKTKGNLDSAEGLLLDNALYDLRMKYVDRANKP